MANFSSHDINVIRNKQYTADGSEPDFMNCNEPYYDVMRGYLVWCDEIRYYNISPDGYEKLQDILLARHVFFHFPEEDHSHISDSLKSNIRSLWDIAEREIPFWPGFQRLALNVDEVALYEKEKREFQDTEAY